jgi:predicted RNase H-like HicB family nuclease
MTPQLKIVFWKGEQFWVGKFIDHPEIMSQGESLDELEQNLRDAYREMLMDDVPSAYQMKEIAL